MNKTALILLLMLFLAPAACGILTHAPKAPKIPQVSSSAIAASAKIADAPGANIVPYTTRIMAPERPSIDSVISNPKSFIGKTISFRSASCVDIPRGSFLCHAASGRKTIRIEAGGLGASGGDLVAERLIGPCKGKDKIGKQICRFDITVEPTSAIDEATMEEFRGERITRIYSPLIEMTISKRN